MDGLVIGASRGARGLSLAIVLGCVWLVLVPSAAGQGSGSSVLERAASSAGDGQPTVDTGQGGGEAGEGDSQPGADPGVDEPSDAPIEDGGVIRFGSFAEGVELRALVEYAADTLDLNVAVAPSLAGEVMFNASFEVPRDGLLPLVNSLLEQNGFMMTRDRQGFYSVVPSGRVPVGSALEGALTTSRVIRTPNVRPSAMEGAIISRLGIEQGQQAQQRARIEFIDELGVILVTDTPERCDAVALVVEQVLDERAQFRWVRLDVRHVSAGVAKQRAIGLVTGGASDGEGLSGAASREAQARAQRAAQQGGAVSALLGGGFESITERLVVEPQGNSLVFHGREEEIQGVRELIDLVDRPSTLTSKRYYAGSMTEQIAQFAEYQGLGTVTSMTAATGAGATQGRAAQQAQDAPPEGGLTGGPTLVVDAARGFIVYYATPEQQAVLASLIEQFEPEDQTIVIREYPLEHSDAEEVAELLRALLLDEVQTGEGGLLPQNQQGQTRAANQPARQLPGAASGVGDEAAFTGDPSLVNITADIPNNQLLIRAPLQQQGEIAKVLAKIDVRKPQVYIDVKIVTMTNSDDFRLAMETQLVNAGGAGGVGRTNFGLSAIPDGGSITDIAAVGTGLPGLTSALILSDQLPFVINAIQTVTDAKLLSNPTLLVDNNVEAEIVSLREEPTTQQSQGDATTITSFQGFQEAGTTLTVTPRISKGGYLSLDYNIEQSNFDGEGSAGIPPPRLTQNVSAESVTIPTDATIVVGGITIRDVSETIAKVPFIGDIPLIGQAFRDTRQSVSDRVLYVFITPRILSDRSFAGHRLLTEGPRRISDLGRDIPKLEIRTIPIAGEPVVDAEPQDGGVGEPESGERSAGRD